MSDAEEPTASNQADTPDGADVASVAAIASIPPQRLKAAIEIAFGVARAGQDADPVEPAPAALRRYLSFARLPAPALAMARRVIDDDAEFRRRVAEATTVEEAGEEGWLWLTRPAGWEERLGELAGLAQRRREDKSAQRDERSLRRKIGELEEALRRAEAAVATAKEQALADRAELEAERSRRRAAEQGAGDAETARTAAEADVARVTTELARMAAERDRVVARLAELERGSVEQPDLRPQPPPEPKIDRNALSRAIATASAAMAEATRLVDAGLASGRADSRPGSGSGSGSGLGSGSASDAPPARKRRSGNRHPVKLPGGVLDDGVEAAEHLVRVPDALLLVDGYNISNALAPGQPLREQRTRLIDALSELQARTGTAVEVVFDGAVAPDPWVSGGRPSVHVQFSPPDVEADDVLVDLIATLPASRPVILATSDRGLRDRARRHGANLLGARQLLAVMRR